MPIVQFLDAIVILRETIVYLGLDFQVKLDETKHGYIIARENISSRQNTAEFVANIFWTNSTPEIS